MRLKTSVVIPAYNEEQCIKNCLESLFNQQVLADEIILIDNNCTDKTVKIASKYPIRIIKETVQGMIPARNTGYNNARYDILVKCDADAIVPPEWIKKIKYNYETFPIDALTGLVYFYDVFSKSVFFYRLALEIIKIMLRGKETLSGANCSLKNTVWKKVRNHLCTNEGAIHEDLDLAIHLHQLSKTIRRDNSLIVGTSARRIKKKPYSTFIEYPIRSARTILQHSLSSFYSHARFG